MNFSKRIAGATATVLVSFALSSSATAAFGYCSKPFAPSDFISKPSKPYCAAMRNCSDWEVQSYKSDVESYFRKLKSYLADVDQYYEDAYKYAKCMAELD
jgi:hypothetical protein